MGRRILSRIERLPDKARPAVELAAEQVRERRLTQGEILSRLNRTIRTEGGEPLPMSTFNRWASKVRGEASEAASNALLDSLTPTAKAALERFVRAVRDDREGYE